MNFVIYGKDGCPFCERAKALIKQKGGEYSYLTLNKDFTREELLELVPEAKTFPQIWVEDDEEFTIHIGIGGYDDLEKYFSESLIEQDLNNGATIRVTFTKKDGTERTMLCTRNPLIIAEYYTAPEKTKETTRKKSEGVVPVFDLDKNSWRSFDVDSVIGYTVIEEITE